MKFLEVVYGDNVSRFALDEIRSYHIVSRPKVRKDPAHHLVMVEQKPVKQLDQEGHGEVVEKCQIDSWRYETYEDARAAVQIVEA